MTQIDAARLSRVLASLTKPKDRTQASDTPQEARQTGTPHQQVFARDPVVLKSRLQGRLKQLKDQADFQAIAPIVTVQEILRWEFGEEVIQHPEFERIASKVTSVMLAENSLNISILRVISELAEE